MIQIGFLLLLCIAVATPAQAEAPAPPEEPKVEKVACVHDVVAANNFNATQFAGTWYEVRKFFPPPGRKGTCEAVKYKANADGTLTVDVGWVDTQNSTQTRTGTIKTSGAKPTDAQLTVTLEKKSVIYTIFYLVYNKFFGVYACIGDKADVWIFAREREVTELTLQGSIYTVMQSKYPNLSTMLFSKTTQAGCKTVV